MGAWKPGAIVLDPLDERNLETLRRLRATSTTYNRDACPNEILA
jgi:hypothetical protein